MGSRRKFHQVLIMLAMLPPAAYAAKPETQPQVADSTAAPVGQQLTPSELDAMRSQIAGCWFIDPSMKGSDAIVVQVQTSLLPDGTVQTAQVVDQARMHTDSTYRAVAEAAQRAILKCHQLRLPPEKYNLWKTTTFSFSQSGLSE